MTPFPFSAPDGSSAGQRELTPAAQVRQQFEIGQRLLAVGEDDKAAQRFRAALAINPDHAPSHGELARVLRRQGNLKAAIEEVDRALQIAPDYHYYLYLKGSLLAARGQFKKGQALVERAIELNPNSAPYHVMLGSIIHRGNMAQNLGGWTHLHRRAEASVRRALELSPNDVSAHRVLGSILESLRQPEAAQRHFEQALQINPEDSLNHTVVGLSYLGANEPERAVEHLRESLRHDPTDKGVQGQLARAKLSIRCLQIRFWLWNLFFGRLPRLLRVPVAVGLIFGLILIQDKVQHFSIEKWRPYHQIFIWLLLAYILILACIADWFARPPRAPREDQRTKGGSV